MGIRIASSKRRKSFCHTTPQELAKLNHVSEAQLKSRAAKAPNRWNCARPPVWQRFGNRKDGLTKREISSRQFAPGSQKGLTRRISSARATFRWLSAFLIYSL